MYFPEFINSYKYRLSNFAFSDENLYLKSLIIYVNENNNKTEHDFLSLNIKILNEDLKAYENLTEKKIRIEVFKVRKKNHPKENLNTNEKYPLIESLVKRYLDSIPGCIKSINHKTGILKIKRGRIPQKPTKESKNIEETLWFKVGLEFAKGNAQLLLKEFSHSEVSKKLLKDKKYRPYFGQTFANLKETDKNIFSNHNKVKQILEYCKKNKIEVVTNFMECANKW